MDSILSNLRQQTPGCVYRRFPAPEIMHWAIRNGGNLMYTNFYLSRKEYPTPHLLALFSIFLAHNDRYGIFAALIIETKT